MDTSDHYNMNTLFQQLGLPAGDDEIEAFVQDHQIEDSERIEEAAFWTVAQSTFLQESIAEDSDWAELVDHLDALLRK